MVGWLTLRLSRVSFCDPQADSQGRRQEAAGHGCPIWGTGCRKARVGENFRPNHSRGFGHHNGVITAERPHHLRNRTNSSHRGVNSRKSASRGKKKRLQGWVKQDMDRFGSEIVNSG